MSHRFSCALWSSGLLECDVPVTCGGVDDGFKEQRGSAEIRWCWDDCCADGKLGGKSCAWTEEETSDDNSILLDIT
jgi:hypothetical protein